MIDFLHIERFLRDKCLRLFVVCVSLILLSPIFLYSNSFAEPDKAPHRTERIIKRKPQEKAAAHDSSTGGTHSQTIKGPDALESSHSFPSTSEESPGQEIVEAVILLDSSRSMQKTDPKRIRDQGAKLFLQFLEPEDKAAIIEFADKANVLTELKAMKGTSMEEINSILEGIKNEGNFTNFLPPLDLAFDLLISSEEKNSSKVIVLLTDGQMDPGPSPELRTELIEKLMKEKVPEIHKRRIKVYTIGLSELADKDLLSEIAKKTDGHSEYAKDVNTIHKVFSDLFLSIKKPQVLELESGGFSIDGNTGEATFFINRLLETDSVTVIDPTGNEYVNKDFPARWKWFRGDLFDVITIPSPLPGRWGIKGGSGDLSGFAKLLSDLKLEYSFPAQTYSIGDSAVVKVRLTESGKLIDDPNFAGLIFYSYKIVNAKSGQLYLQGQLADKGDRGDEKSGDGVFSDTITLNEEGEYKLFLVATAPTFTRQAHIPFSVSKGIISLTHIAKNEFTGASDKYLVSLHSQAKDLSKRIVVAEAKVNEDKIQINLEKYRVEENLYEIPVDKLKPGENRVIALVQGLDESKHEVRAKSEEVLIHVEAHHAENGDRKEGEHGTEEAIHITEEGAEVEKHPGEHSGEESIQIEPDIVGEVTGEAEEEVKEEPTMIYGLIGIFISLISSFFIARLFIKKSKTEGGTTVVVRDEYEIPAALSEQIELIMSKVSTEVREFYPNEMEMFSGLVGMDSKVEKASEGGASATAGLEGSSMEESSPEAESQEVGAEAPPEAVGEDQENLAIEEPPSDSAEEVSGENEEENEEAKDA